MSDRSSASDESNEATAEGARPAGVNRDPVALRADLERWLTDRLGAASAPAVTSLDMPSANGMSSDTVLFEAEWTDADSGERASQRLVARVAPDADAVPVFPTYDLESQFATMRTVAELTDVPVPEVLWLETDPEAIGSPFFVMRRVDGIVPPDVMPYNFGSWVTEATPDERLRLQRSTVSALARLHAIPDAAERFDFLEGAAEARAGASPLRRHVDAQRRYYDWVTDGGARSPLIERAFDWLDEHWPEDEGPTVLSWGDARIGNVMYADFEPVAVLDWEMAALAPREIDLGWMIFLHRFFEDIAVVMELPGLPDFMRRSEVAATYEELSGHAPQSLDWFTTYAALRHGIVMSRVKRRAIAYGEAEMPDDVDDLIMHRAALEAMLDGTYWSSVPS